jgi:hypothetical protein
MFLDHPPAGAFAVFQQRTPAQVVLALTRSFQGPGCRPHRCSKLLLLPDSLDKGLELSTGTTSWGTHTGRVLDLGNSFFSTTFSQQDASGRRVSEDVSTNRLSTISPGKQSAGSRVTLDLVCLHDTVNMKLSSNMENSVPLARKG